MRFFIQRNERVLFRRAVWQFVIGNGLLSGKVNAVYAELLLLRQFVRIFKKNAAAVAKAIKTCSVKLRAYYFAADNALVRIVD